MVVVKDMLTVAMMVRLRDWKMGDSMVYPMVRMSAAISVGTKAPQLVAAKV